jgi:hypothetical protein
MRRGGGLRRNCIRISLLFSRRTADYRCAPGATSLFVGDDNLLLRRIDDEYGQQPSRLRRAGVGAHLMVVAGHLRPAFSCLVDMLGLVVDFATNLTFQHGCIDEGRGGCRCEGDAAPGPYSTSTARMFLPGTLGSSRSKTFDTFDAGAFVSCAAAFVDSSEVPASSSKAIFFTVTLLLIRGLSIRSVPNRQSVSVQL